MSCKMEILPSPESPRETIGDLSTGDYFFRDGDSWLWLRDDEGHIVTHTGISYEFWDEDLAEEEVTPVDVRIIVGGL